MEFTSDQRTAFDLMVSGQNCFITGGAGVGKSFLTNEFISHIKKNTEKKILVCAPTGIAAMNIGGVTIHSLFNIPVKQTIFTRKDVDSRFHTYRSLKSDKVKNPVFYSDIIVIDEISMCRGDIFDMIMASIDGVIANKHPGFKKKIQIILVGDFFQLPPVLTDNTNIAIDGEYETIKISSREQYHNEYNNNEGYAFLSDRWAEKKFTTCFLNEVVRQDDKEFIEALNKLRFGSGDISWLLQKHSPSIMDNAVWICGRNSEVEYINNLEYDKIKSVDEYLYSWGFCVADKDYYNKENELMLEASKIVNPELMLKKGCKVIITANKYDDKAGDKSNPLYFNGMSGTVVFCGEDEIVVQLDPERNGGLSRRVSVFRHEFEIKRYVLMEVPGSSDSAGKDQKINNNDAYSDTNNNVIDYDNIDSNQENPEFVDSELINDKPGENNEKNSSICEYKIVEKTVAIARQFPLLLGYAITVHRSQGQTLARANINGNINFSCGQMYVAFSRIKEIENLHVHCRNCRPKVSDSVIKFYNGEIEKKNRRYSLLENKKQQLGGKTLN